MRARFTLATAALLFASAPAPVFALDLQTLKAAQDLLYPGATLTPADFVLTDAQMDRLKTEYLVPVMRPQVKAWRVNAKGDWLYLDQVYGLNDIITYVVAVGANGKVRGVEILVCVEGYCDISTPEWRARFKELKDGRWTAESEKTAISGNTLSSVHVSEGVKKILAIHAHFLPK